jgi:uncharacterized glyoxalase superfamily protein PhnB
MSNITQSVITSLTIKGAAEALEFYKRAFGAVERYRLEGPGGVLMHAEMQIGDSVMMMSDEFPDWGALSPETIGGCPVTVVLYVPDADASFAQAIAAGAKEKMPVSDQFWGDRMGSVTDPYGYKWSLATHKEILSPEQIKERFKDFAKDCS